MLSRGPNYYFETVMNHIERRIAEENPALILVHSADWKVLRAMIPKSQRTIVKDAQERPYQMVVKDEFGIERTFQLVVPEDAPSGTLNLTEVDIEE